MEKVSPEQIKEICCQLTGAKLPRWSELPDFEIYMDQLLSLAARYLKDYPGIDKKGITSSMVNNYVKAGVLPPPEKKKYNRKHLALLIMICILKISLPIAAVKTQLDIMLDVSESYDKIYNTFCSYFERTLSAVSESASKPPEGETELYSSVLYASLRAQAEQTFAMKLLDLISDEKNVVSTENEDDESR